MRAAVDHALTNYVEPRLIEPTFLYDYPVALSPFARLVDGSDDIVERFEGFVGGTEICNAFSELNDAEEQAQRFEMQAEEGAGGNVEAEPGDPDYVEALSLRHAPDRRARLRHRPARDGAARQGLGARRRALPRAALQGRSSELRARSRGLSRDTAESTRQAVTGTRCRALWET